MNDSDDPRVRLVEALWKDPATRAMLRAMIEAKFPGALAKAEVDLEAMWAL